MKPRQDILAIFHAGLEAVDPVAAVQRYVHRQENQLEIQQRLYDLSEYKNIYVVGAGKATAAMAQALEDLLEGHLKGGSKCLTPFL